MVVGLLGCWVVGLLVVVWWLFGCSLVVVWLLFGCCLAVCLLVVVWLWCVV